MARRKRHRTSAPREPPVFANLETRRAVGRQARCRSARSSALAGLGCDAGAHGPVRTRLRIRSTRAAQQALRRCRSRRLSTRAGRCHQCRVGRAPAASSAARDCCIRRTLQKSPGARTATPSRTDDSGRRSVGRSRSERGGDVVLAQPHRCGAQQAAIAAPSRPGSAEQQSVLPTRRCCSRPNSAVRLRRTAPPARRSHSRWLSEKPVQKLVRQLVAGITDVRDRQNGDITGT